MKLPPESIQEFAKLFEEEYGEKPELDQAESMANDLLDFYQLILPMK